MGKESHIQWTDASWNVAVGCKKVDGDCKFCYMYRDSLNGTRYNPKSIRKTKTVFHMPLSLEGSKKIFTSSLTDVFLPEIDPYRHEMWDIIRKCPHHTFQILTKRPERITQCLPPDWGDGWKNVWLGTSIGHSGALQRLWDLPKYPNTIRFVSFEPLWEKIEMNFDVSALIDIQWAIIGGESGNDNGRYRYRPCHVEWIEEIMYNIQSVGNSVFVKQLGTHLAKQMGLKDRHGGNIDEWPEHLKVRQFPKPITE